MVYSRFNLVWKPSAQNQNCLVCRTILKDMIHILQRASIGSAKFVRSRVLTYKILFYEKLLTRPPPEQNKVSENKIKRLKGATQEPS